MRIAVMLSRPWQAIHRFRSFLLNAKALGHKLFCMGPRTYPPNMYDLTEVALAGTGLDLLPTSTRGPYVTDQYDVSAVKPTLDALNVDAVLGECINAPFEWTAQDWAWEHGKLSLVLDHMLPLHGSAWISTAKERAPHSIILVSNEMRYREWRNASFNAKVVGQPEFDLIQDDYNIAAIREGLNTFEGQSLIAFFDAFADYRAEPVEVPENEAKVMDRTLSFFQHAQEQNWRVVIHLHPGERAWINSRGPEGLTFSWRYPFLKTMQDLGGKYICDVASGQIGELIFQKCDSFALLAAADCVVGTAPEVSDKAYVMGKWYVNLTELPTCVQGLQWPNIRIDLSPDFSTLAETLEYPWRERDSAFIEKWFYRLDKSAWRRILDVCEGRL